MFGKKFSEYVRFERWILILITVVFVIRLAMSLHGTAFPTASRVSINMALLFGLIYCSVGVHLSGFGSYSQLFGLLLIQNAFAHILIGLGIALAIVTGTPNIYTAPEVFGGNDGANWFHAALHVIVGPVLTVFSWLIGSVILFVTKKLKPA